MIGEAREVIPTLPPAADILFMDTDGVAVLASLYLDANARRKLEYLDAACVLEDLRVPSGNRLEALKEDRSGQHSIRVNDQFRLCFRWTRGDAYDVEICDYH